MEETTHLALPLKYRPMTFSDVVGQENVVKTLRNAIEYNRIANAYLFIGSRGIGKTTLSRIFAKALNCRHEGDSGSIEPCGKCVNCHEIAAGRSLDVIELDAASHNKVEDVRPIIEAVQFQPVTSKYKIFIIDECHMLSAAAWNALLKTLEEPPPYVKFVFATTEGDKVLATIVSRCQRFDLRRIQTNDIVSRLKYICGKENIDADEDALLAIARGAEGGMRDALSSLDQLVSFKGTKILEEDALSVFGLVSRSALENLASAIINGESAKILDAIELFDSSGKNLRRLAAELLNHFRNLVVAQALGTDAKALEATQEQMAVLAEQAKNINSERLFRICDQLVELEDKLRYVLSVRTVLEMSLIRAGRIATTATIEEIMKAVRALKESGDVNALKEVYLNPRPAPESTNIARPSTTIAPQTQNLPPEPRELPEAKQEVKHINPTTRRQMLDDELVNSIISSTPGSQLVDIKEASK
ncbi:MAG: DNA polymerase III subunit gamma/tau [Kiritimatiellae bacterium]|nr:DNA polymerase III subunit gamma/tau [Kiritimatiellia bacterium]